MPGSTLSGKVFASLATETPYSIHPARAEARAIGGFEPDWRYVFQNIALLPFPMGLRVAAGAEPRGAAAFEATELGERGGAPPRRSTAVIGGNCASIAREAQMDYKVVYTKPFNGYLRWAAATRPKEGRAGCTSRDF